MKWKFRANPEPPPPPPPPAPKPAAQPVRRRAEPQVALPPQDLTAERAVLGSMMIEHEAVVKAMELLQERDFYQESHRKIFAAIIAIEQRGDRADIVTLISEMRRRKTLDDFGTLEKSPTSVLAEMAHEVATAAHVEYYAGSVKRKSVLRDLITVSTNTVKECYADSKEPDQILDEAQSAVLRVAEKQVLRGVVSAQELAVKTLERTEKLFKDKRSVTGVPTGLRDLDELTTGFQPSDLVLIAARPSQGKTALALNVALHSAMTKRIPTLVFSLEMSQISIMQRMLSTVTEVNLKDVTTGFFPQHRLKPISEAAGRIAESPLWVVDTPGLTVMNIRSLSRQLAADLARKKQKLGLVIIDYLQLMRGHAGGSENRQQEVSEISRGLKHLARDLDVPVLALSQLSRKTEDKFRQDPRPQLSDLRESGALEQDADVVAFIYREAYYKPWEPMLETKAEIIVAKQRQGPTGSVHAVFHRHITRFANEAKRRAET